MCVCARTRDCILLVRDRRTTHPHSLALSLCRCAQLSALKLSVVDKKGVAILKANLVSE